MNNKELFLQIKERLQERLIRRKRNIREGLTFKERKSGNPTVLEDLELMILLYENENGTMYNYCEVKCE